MKRSYDGAAASPATISGSPPSSAGACDVRIPGARAGRVHIAGGSYDMARPPATPVLAEVRGEGRAPWLGDEQP